MNISNLKMGYYVCVPKLCILWFIEKFAISIFTALITEVNYEKFNNRQIPLLLIDNHSFSFCI